MIFVLMIFKISQKRMRRSKDSTPRRESGGAGQVSGSADPRKGRLTVPMGSLWRRPGEVSESCAHTSPTLLFGADLADSGATAQCGAVVSNLASRAHLVRIVTQPGWLRIRI